MPIMKIKIRSRGKAKNPHRKLMNFNFLQGDFNCRLADNSLIDNRHFRHKRALDKDNFMAVNLVGSL